MFVIMETSKEGVEETEDMTVESVVVRDFWFFVLQRRICSLA